jgi:deoxyribonuclease (pyrimidine dimer)
MTRINCIEPRRLTNKHLQAEYRELLRTRHIKPQPTVVPRYVLGKGHVNFFSDKGGYLVERHEQLRNEMKRRGFATNYTLELDWPAELMGNWQPTTDAKLQNVARIINRLK